MRLRVYSDLHNELSGFDPGSGPKADVVVLAGDIDTGTRGLHWALERFADLPVVYVAGNHEFYGQRHPKVIDQLRHLSQGTPVHFLENQAVVVNGIRFLGCTFWTDFQLFGRQQRQAALMEAGLRMSDYRRIRLGRAERYRRLRPTDTEYWHRRSLAWLRETLTQPFDGPTVVVTHHAPDPRSIAADYAQPDHVGDLIDAGYASRITPTDLPLEAIDLWIHGHTHTCVDYRHHGMRVVANQRGYLPDEPVTAFEAGFMVSLS